MAELGRSAVTQLSAGNINKSLLEEGIQQRLKLSPQVFNHKVQDIIQNNQAYKRSRLDKKEKKNWEKKQLGDTYSQEIYILGVMLQVLENSYGKMFKD